MKVRFIHSLPGRNYQTNKKFQVIKADEVYQTAERPSCERFRETKRPHNYAFNETRALSRMRQEHSSLSRS